MLNAVGFGQAPISASVSGTSFSVQEGQSVSISSELTVSNPDGDNVTEYQFLNSGGDGGGFVVGGTTEAAGQWFEVSAANLTSVSYVGGSSAGTDTLQVEVFDATSGTWSSVTTFTATTIGQTADMIMRDGNNGNYEIYGIGSNAILTAAALGQIGLEWQVAGLGDFSGTDTSDMLTRDSNNGVFEVYDIRNNQITSAAPIGQVGHGMVGGGLWRFFDTRQRDRHADAQQQHTGNFEVYDISNNTITFAAPMGQVGMEWTIAGFGDFSGRVNETDMLMRNNNTGAFEVLRHQQQQPSRSRPGWGKSGWNGRLPDFGDFSGNANETDMLMQQQQYRCIRGLRYQQQSDHLRGRDGAGRAGVADRGLRRLVERRRRDRHADAQQQ